MAQKLSIAKNSMYYLNKFPKKSLVSFITITQQKFSLELSLYFEVTISKYAMPEMITGANIKAWCSILHNPTTHHAI